MGFTVSLGRTEAANAMVNGVPFLKDNTTELRQWTVRQLEGGGYKYSPPTPVSPPPEIPVRTALVMPDVDLKVTQVVNRTEERQFICYQEEPVEFDYTPSEVGWNDGMDEFDAFSWC